MTGILDIQEHLIEQSGAIIEIKNGIPGQKWSLSGEIDLHNIAVMNEKLLIKQSGKLIEKDRKKEAIVTTLDSIDHVSVL
jgi:hypothetical protein